MIIDYLLIIKDYYLRAMYCIVGDLANNPLWTNFSCFPLVQSRNYPVYQYIPARVLLPIVCSPISVISKGHLPLHPLSPYSLQAWGAWGAWGACMESQELVKPHSTLSLFDWGSSTVCTSKRTGEGTGHVVAKLPILGGWLEWELLLIRLALMNYAQTQVHSHPYIPHIQLPSAETHTQSHILIIWAPGLWLFL